MDLCQRRKCDIDVAHHQEVTASFSSLALALITSSVLWSFVLIALTGAFWLASYLSVMISLLVQAIPPVAPGVLLWLLLSCGMVDVLGGAVVRDLGSVRIIAPDRDRL
jgi:hypothetical protein